jgi:hypothetical protein
MATSMEGISAPAACANEMDPQMLTLKATEDKFGGIIIDSPCLPRDTSVFLHSLKRSLMEWKAQVKFSRISNSLANIIPSPLQ